MKQLRAAGLSLVEILLTMALMGTLLLSVSNLLIKVQANRTSYSKLAAADIELNTLLEKMKGQLQNASWIDSTSYNQKIVFTTLDSSGNAQRVGYRITTSGSMTVLEYSSDGTTWGTSPYAILSSTNYNIDSGEFLYCGYSSNCTRFQDTNANGSWASGETRTQVTGTALLTNASYSQKVILSGFIFNRQQGNPQVKRTWPDIYISLPDRHVATQTQLVKQFSTTPGSSNSFSTGSVIKGLAYDANKRRLLAVGSDTGTDNYIYQLSRDGIPVMPLVDVGNLEFDDVCLDASGTYAWSALWGGTTTLYRYDLTTPAAAANTITFTATSATYFNTGGSATALACDPVTSNKVYVIGRTSGGVQSIMPVTLDTSGNTATAGTRVTLPGAMTNGTTEALVIDPMTGDYYALQQALSGSDPSKTITVYHIDASSPTTSDPFTLNISNLYTTSPTSAVGWGMAYDPTNNHVFIADSDLKRVYEFAPPRLWSPK
jgi:Tfp pilus assembly protein PilV